MKVDTKNKEELKYLLKQAILNSTYELECLFGVDFTGNNKITDKQFEKVISRINGKKEFITNNPYDKLLISFPRDSKFNDLRITVTGYQAIDLYCKQEKLDNIMRYVSFEKKTRVNDKVSRVNIPDYQLRFNQKKETPVDVNSSLVRECMQQWENLPKVFRYKKQYSYQTLDKEFSIDCAIVKTSSVETKELSIEQVLKQGLEKQVLKPDEERIPFKDWWFSVKKNPETLVKVKDVNKYYKSIKESKLFNNVFSYEVEIEYLGNKKTGVKKDFVDAKEEEKTKLIHSTFVNYFRYIGIVLQCLQDSFYLMSQSEFFKVVKSYTALIGAKGLSNMKQIFFGPLPIDLDKNKIIQYDDYVYQNPDRVYESGNILLDYCVTDKSDGVRNLLFVAEDGECYLIGRDSISLMKKVGIKIPKYAMSIFDGEYLEVDKDGEYFNKYMIFDAYFINGKNIMRLPFGDGKGGEKERLGNISHFVKTYVEGSNILLKDGTKSASSKYQFKIDKKSFLFGESSKTPIERRNMGLIFKQCDNLLSKMNQEFGGKLKEGHLYSYETDGLIFTPTRLGVFQKHSKDKVYPSKLTTSVKWDKVYKWKPANLLTLDLRVEILKDGSTGKRKSVFIGNTEYVKCHLKCRNYGGKRLTSNIGSLVLNNGLNLDSLPDETNLLTCFPFIGEHDLEGNLVSSAHQCLLPLSKDGELKCANGEFIQDGMVVEFAYIPYLTEEDRSKVLSTTIAEKLDKPNYAKNWNPLRLRVNKSPNPVKICIDTWNLIYSPVSLDMITQGLNAGGMTGLEKAIELNYYLGGKDFISTPVKKFNNFAKRWVLEKYFAGFQRPRVLDLACGKMGDYPKYLANGVSLCVGMDINPDNLNNYVDGAASRVLKLMSGSQSGKMLGNKTLLMLGNFTENIADGSASFDDLSSYYMDILYGRHKPRPEHNRKLSRFYNIATEGFHMVVCSYAIHYSFITDTTLDTFLENVSQNLKDQGYFVGTCLDGNLILDMVNRQSNKRLEGKINNQLIWSIDRNIVDNKNGNIFNDKGSLVNTNLDSYALGGSQLLGTGNEVSIYFETFNSVSNENLVDIQYLEMKAKEHNLKLIDSRRFTEGPGDLIQEWEVSDNRNVVKDWIKNIKEEKTLQTWADFQRYFVFQKVEDM